jgi:hypothetical protein
MSAAVEELKKKARKVYYECGCVGYYSTIGVYARVSSCAGHEAIPQIVKPDSKVVSIKGM